MVEIVERRVRTVRLELPGGREVRAALYPGRNGEDGEIILRTSWPEEPFAGGRQKDSLRLPADALPELRVALDALTEDDPE